MPTRRTYARNQSRLYKIKSPAQLATVLRLKQEELKRLVEADDNYLRWIVQKTERAIQRPRPLLERVHRRVGILLARIETPEFLHSAVKGRSYISNAEQHAIDKPTVKIDIRKFYPSVRAQAVFHLFRDRMFCAGDVAGILARLLTVDGHLATGSSVSPILSYFAYEDMFGEIEELAIQRGCEMTCYVDDLVFTGPGATRRLVHDLTQIVRRYRLWVHKIKVFQAGQPKVITGVAMTKVGKRLPNKRQQTIKREMTALRVAKTNAARLLIMHRLTSRLFAAAQVDPATWGSKALQMSAAMRHLQLHSTAGIAR